MHGTQAPGTNVHRPDLAVNEKTPFADIGHPHTIGASFGVAHIMAKLERFTTEIAFSRQKLIPFD